MFPSLSLMHVTAFFIDQQLCRWCFVIRLPCVNEALLQVSLMSRTDVLYTRSCINLQFGSQRVQLLYPLSSYKLLMRTLSSLLNTIIYKHRVTTPSRHFRRCYLKANKLIKSEGTRKVEYAYHFWKCADVICQKYRISPCLSKHSLPKLARFSDTMYITSVYPGQWLDSFKKCIWRTKSAAEWLPRYTALPAYGWTLYRIVS